jgi:hypothetical protein
MAKDHYALLALRDTEVFVVWDALWSHERDEEIAREVADRVHALLGLNVKGEQGVRFMGLGRARGRPQG